jgi:hypothetical protein
MLARIELERRFGAEHLKVNIGVWVKELCTHLERKRAGVEGNGGRVLVVDEAVVNVRLDGTENELGRGEPREGGNVCGDRDTRRIEGNMVKGGEGNVGALDYGRGANVEVPIPTVSRRE